MALAKLPQAFDLPSTKGYFPQFLTPQVIRIIPVRGLPRHSMA